MKSYYQRIETSIIELDLDNPRIARILEMYGGKITSEAISLALGDSGESSGTSYSSLRESIKTNQGIIHPIIVNRKPDNTYTVIEGNTRVQIYREFEASKVKGDWTKIDAIVFEDLDRNTIHSIRLQSHLVGPRDWDPYSKAKYLTYLSDVELMPIVQIISFCGGNSSEVQKMIKAYKDMEKYYRAKLGSSTFDPRKFSAFVELQNKGVLDAIQFNGFTKEDFAEWVINGNIDKMANVRLLPKVLGNTAATAEFLKNNISEAYKLVDIPGLSDGLLKDATYDQLAAELTKKLSLIPYTIVKSLRDDAAYEDKKNKLLNALEQLKETCDFIIQEK